VVSLVARLLSDVAFPIVPTIRITNDTLAILATIEPLKSEKCYCGQSKRGYN